MVPGCSAQEALIAARAQYDLRGLAENDLRLCAGVPDRTATATAPDGTTRHYWTYVRSPPSASGVNFSLPVIGGGLSLSSTGDCRATFELVDGRVMRLGFSGAAELGPARDAACAGVVLGCLDLLRGWPPGTPPAAEDGC